jgi:Protein of unknown function (DUF3667)
MTHPSATSRLASSESEPIGAPKACLNCGASLAGIYCTACGQRAVDLTATTWHVVREALEEAIDFDSRALRTAKALASPGRLTIEFLHGRRVSYLGPLKLFLLAGSVLTTSWIVTRGVDARYYGSVAERSAGAYIDTVVRGSLAAGIAITTTGWVLGRGRRRLLDEAVFALHLVAALALWAAGVFWLGTAWKLVWGTAAAAPHYLPSLPFLVFLPATLIGLAYVVFAVRRVYGGRWWATALRASLIAAVGIAILTGFIAHAA